LLHARPILYYSRAQCIFWFRHACRMPAYNWFVPVNLSKVARLPVHNVSTLRLKASIRVPEDKFVELGC
jgi:hypothetical protein